MRRQAAAPSYAGAAWEDARFDTPVLTRSEPVEERVNSSNPFLGCLGRQGLIPGFEDTCQAVLRPPRDMYSIDQLGPEEFMIDETKCIRQDVTLINARGKSLAGSHYMPVREESSSSWPCVVFCHGNSSSRLEALDAVQVCLPHKLALFCFDFSGCGMSEGEYVTLGHMERQDLKIVIDYLRNSGRATDIAIWGRSMGASTAIFCAAEDPHLVACVLDSPFTRLRTVALELGNEAIPRFMLNMGLNLIRDEVQNRTGADMDSLSPIESAPRARCPAIFAASVEDDFIRPYHAKELQKAWGGVSDLYYFNGPHNCPRPPWFLQEAADWLAKQFYSSNASRPGTSQRSGDPRSFHR